MQLPEVIVYGEKTVGTLAVLISLDAARKL